MIFQVYDRLGQTIRVSQQYSGYYILFNSGTFFQQVFGAIHHSLYSICNFLPTFTSSIWFQT